MIIDTATGQEAPKDISTERVEKIFSEIAHQYDLFNVVSSFGASESWTRKMVELTPIQPTSTVLDVAGGTGAISFALAKAKDPAIIVCSDLVPEMLEVAKEHYAHGAAGSVPVLFSVVDAQNIPFDDDSFDVVTMAYGIRNMPDRQKALEEIYRVLSPGGMLVCLEFTTPPNPLWRDLYTFYRDHLLPFWGSLLTGHKEDFVYLSESIAAFPDQVAFARMLADAGFVDIDWTDLTGGIAAIHRGRKPLDKD